MYRLIRAYAFVWRMLPIRLALRLFEMDYNRLMMRLLNTQRNFDESIVHQVERQFWFGAMRLDLAKPTQRSLYFEHEYEKHVTRCLETYLKPGETFIDVGAHVGYYSLMASRLVGTEGQVVSFEPNQENFVRLCGHVKLNDVRNIRPLNLAVSDKGGLREFFVNPFNDGGHSLQSFDGYEALRKVRVESISLDEFVEKQLGGKAIEFVKIDVEGHQLNVLRGMQRILRRSMPKIILEMSETDRGNNDVFQLLESQGYQYCRLDNSNYFFLPRGFVFKKSGD